MRKHWWLIRDLELTITLGLHRGTRQGDTVSPALFTLSTEPLSEMIGSNPQIQGIADKGENMHKTTDITKWDVAGRLAC